MYYFSENYAAGREMFYEVCDQAGLKIAAHVNSVATGPGGEELAMDVVWHGPEKAEKVLLITSGTHGLEAAPGSATILKWISDGAYRHLPESTAVMIVHAVNPFGWAHSSRTNEDNIDLNRNFLDHGAPYPQNTFYPELHDLVLSEDVSDCGLDASIQRFRDFSHRNGANAAMHGITGGQFTNPKGISFGGNSPSWSYKTLLKVVREKLVFAKKVVSIDLHTGIGEFSEPFIIMMDDKQSEPYQRASDWWGEKYIHYDDIFGRAGTPDYFGLLLQNLQQEIRALNDADVLSTVIEFGTYGLDSMLQALFIDRKLRYNTEGLTEAEVLVLRTRLIERFYPSLPEWRHAILGHSERIYRQTLQGLKTW